MPRRAGSSGNVLKQTYKLLMFISERCLGFRSEDTAHYFQAVAKQLQTGVER